MNKSAKEMFEELGYEYQECKLKNKVIYIDYITEYKYDTCVSFSLRDKTYITFCKEDKSAYVDMDFHEAINKQVEELGWNND